MHSRRDLLQATTSLVIVATVPCNAACAFILPVILASIAALTALSLATGKAADALETAIKNGKRLYATVGSLSDFTRAQHHIRTRQLYLEQQVKEQQYLLNETTPTQLIGGWVVAYLYSYTITRNPGDWTLATNDIYNASASLSHMALMFREKAVWFPQSAQDNLAELPRLYEARVSILRKLAALKGSEPPSTEEEIKALTELITAYDRLAFNR
jgi:hypothetical protein